MSNLQRVLRQEFTPGLYRFRSEAEPETLAGEAQAAGWQYIHLDGATIKDKAGFLAAAKTAFAMPGYVGKNWDALEEAVNDLSWLPPGNGYVVVYDSAQVFGEHNPRGFGVACAILEGAVQNWAANGVPFYVLMRGAGVYDDPALASWPPDDSEA